MYSCKAFFDTANDMKSDTSWWKGRDHTMKFNYLGSGFRIAVEKLTQEELGRRVEGVPITIGPLAEAHVARFV
jgi:hypothetical protein